ncbi:hypothetical protein EZ449_17455 [Pedobacter frigidisoli]|uniref:Uncharacterized protein n=1 Tax=Pedobacter frigidisoli TaxID=2530455 RepID=A0A4R0NWE8_9SPHI|nr:DUF6544 family protein [Pedobacter frigidisoli]TCD04423.1 hypothetical protein EZ449_17455 [Pedobacter frigidisoli]
MLIILYILTGSLVLYFILVLIYQLRYKMQVKKLFSLQDRSPQRKFNLAQLAHLPPPVVSYFKLVLKNGQAYPRSIRLKHGGLFKLGIDKPWIPISGAQYFTPAPAGFIWKGDTAWFSARDIYIGATGTLEVLLFSALKIVSSKGKIYDQGELLRWLAESVWFPTNLLPDENKQWFAIDSENARLKVSIDGVVLNYLVTFNERGEIARLATRRYMTNKLETWIINLSSYREINSVKIPFYAEASWKLEDKLFTYARFSVRKVEYDKPYRF